MFTKCERKKKLCDKSIRSPPQIETMKYNGGQAP